MEESNQYKRIFISPLESRNLSGTVHAPASKSSMQRACAAALVRKGISIIHNPGISNDDKVALNIIKELGVRIEKLEDKIIINSNGIPFSPSGDGGIHCGESGLSIRMFTPIAALSQQPIIITGEGSLMERPMNFFDEILPQLKVEIHSHEGKLPLRIHGPLQPKNITIDGSLSSQFLTGLLLAYSASNADGISISVNNLKSKPYIDLTLKVMNDFGLQVPVNHQYEKFIFNKSEIGNQKSEIEYTVEGDWSGAAFLLVAGAISGNITVKGLDINSTQADKKIIEALKDCGASIIIESNEIKVSNPSSGIRGFDFDATDCPDLFPPLVALAAHGIAQSSIKGVSRLMHKESNRASTLKEEFSKFGVEIILEGDVMKVNGGKVLKGTTVSSHHDHRIAMACAVAALNVNGQTVIEDADAINKSYPNFYEHLKMLGVNINY